MIIFLISLFIAGALHAGDNAKHATPMYGPRQALLYQNFFEDFGNSHPEERAFVYGLRMKMLKNDPDAVEFAQRLGIVIPAKQHDATDPLKPSFRGSFYELFGGDDEGAQRFAKFCRSLTRLQYKTLRFAANKPDESAVIVLGTRTACPADYALRGECLSHEHLLPLLLSRAIARNPDIISDAEGFNHLWDTADCIERRAVLLAQTHTTFVAACRLYICNPETKTIEDKGSVGSIPTNWFLTEFAQARNVGDWQINGQPAILVIPALRDADGIVEKRPLTEDEYKQLDDFLDVAEGLISHSQQK